MSGEAGISEWIAAVNDKFPHWKVYISPKLTDAEYAEGQVNELLDSNSNVTYSDDLHLAVSLRSYRAEKLSAFVHQQLSLDKEAAAATYREIKDRYPIVLTRARVGMVICVPAGNANKTPSGFWEDSTRLPEFYDGTYRYLKEVGVEEI